MSSCVACISAHNTYAAAAAKTRESVCAGAGAAIATVSRFSASRAPTAIAATSMAVSGVSSSSSLSAPENARIARDQKALKLAHTAAVDPLTGLAEVKKYLEVTRKFCKAEDLHLYKMTDRDNSYLISFGWYNPDSHDNVYIRYDIKDTQVVINHWRTKKENNIKMQSILMARLIYESVRAGKTTIVASIGSKPFGTLEDHNKNIIRLIIFFRQLGANITPESIKMHDGRLQVDIRINLAGLYS